MNRKECLEESIKCVCTDRKEQYGNAEDSFKAIADFFQVYINHRCLKDGKVKITAQDASNLLILFKVARMTTGIVHKDDTYIDIAGYAACSCELGESKEPTEGELIDKYGVDKKTNEPMLCSEIGGCRKCLFAESDCYDSMREWIKSHFTDDGKMVGTDTNVGTKKPKFRLEDYKGRYVMHCDTEEKAEIFCRYLHVNGFNWYDGDWYITNTCFYNYEEKTCYEFGCGLHGNLDDYMDMSFEILEFEDFDWSEYGVE